MILYKYSVLTSNYVFRREKWHLTDAVSGPMGRSNKATSFGRGFFTPIPKINYEYILDRFLKLKAPLIAHSVSAFSIYKITVTAKEPITACFGIVALAIVTVILFLFPAKI